MRLDEPLGRNDGSYKGVKYFTCPAGYGVFTRGCNVTVGYFPELDILLEGDEEEEDEEDDGNHKKCDAGVDDDEDEI